MKKDKEDLILEELKKLAVLNSDMDKRLKEVVETQADHTDRFETISEALDTMVEKLDNKVDRKEFESRIQPLERKLA